MQLIRYTVHAQTLLTVEQGQLKPSNMARDDSEFTIEK